MAEIKQIKLNNVLYDIKDGVARESITNLNRDLTKQKSYNLYTDGTNTLGKDDLCFVTAIPTAKTGNFFNYADLNGKIYLPFAKTKSLSIEAKTNISYNNIRIYISNGVNGVYASVGANGLKLVGTEEVAISTDNSTGLKEIKVIMDSTKTELYIGGVLQGSISASKYDNTITRSYLWFYANKGDIHYFKANLIYQTSDIYSKLNNKYCLFLGDSICYGAGYVGGYAKKIGDKTGMNYENKGVGGYTITVKSASPTTSITTVATGITTDIFDIISIQGLINDVDLNNLGTVLSGYDVTSADVTTFSGALEKLLSHCVNTFKKAKIRFITTYKVNNATNQKAYTDRAKEICQKWGVEVIDLYYTSKINSGISWINTTLFNNADYFHVNSNGYDYIVLDIQSAMENTL